MQLNDIFISFLLASCIPLQVRGLDLAADSSATPVATKEDLHVMVAVMEEELEKVKRNDIVIYWITQTFDNSNHFRFFSLNFHQHFIIMLW